MEVGSKEELHSEIQRLNPVELLIAEDLSGLDFLEKRIGVRRRCPWEFDLDAAQRQLNKHFATHDLTGFGCGHLTLAIGAAGCLYSICTEIHNVVIYPIYEPLQQKIVTMP